MIRLKDGVSIKMLTGRMALGARIVEGIYESMGLVCYVTSGDDSEHGPGSKHPLGDALDFRTETVPLIKRAELAERAHQALGGPKGQFDVVLEVKTQADGTKVSHLHVEYDAD